MADLSALRELAAFMRETGATRARVGELELQLGPPPPPVGTSPTSSTDDGGDSLDALLYGTGLDPKMFRGRAA